MKKFLVAFAVLLTSFTSANAMSYEQAREQALFLADKMAYELNLTEDQFEAVYEINLDYLMGVNTVDDVFSDYWTRRNLDMSYILLDWQYRAFCAAEYFYRPLYWNAGYWHFRIFAHYPHRNYFYYGCPGFYHTYHGAHAWHMNNGRSWYHGRTYNHSHGMRDGWNRGGYRNMNNGWRPNDGGNRGLSGSANHGRRNGNGSSYSPSRRENGSNQSTDRGNRDYNNNRGNGSYNGNRGNSSYNGDRGTRGSSTRRTVGDGESSSSNRSGYTPSRSFRGNSSSSSSHSSASTPSHSSSSHSSSNGGYSRSSGSYSGGSHSSISGGHSGGGHSAGGHSNGGGHGGFGGGRR